MPPLPKAGAQLELDTSQWDSAYKSVLADAGKLDALDPTVKVSVSDADLKTAAGLVADLDTSTSLKINVDESELDTVNDQLDTITAISAIDLAVNISGTALSFFESLGRFSGVGGILELDTALATIEGRTGRMIPDAEKLITDLYVNGWGESRTAIADTIVQASNLKIANEDLAEATEAAFQVQAVTGGETNEILRSMDTLVKNNLVPSYTAAADLITVGFQTGNDRGQDLLDTFNEYGSTFKQVGISGEGALGLINSGLDAGIDNSDRIADAIRETGIRLGEIGTDENIAAAFEQLDALSDIDLAKSLDAKNAGEISGDEFYAGFFEALADANEADPQAAQTIAATLVGTIAEDFGVESISQLTPIWDETMGTLEGRAETAGGTISGTLGTTIEGFLRAIEQSAVDFLSSDAIDLDGKIATLKEQLTTALSTLTSGGSLGEALEIGFGITGVDTALGNISRVFGQFTLTLLEILAFIQDPLSNNDNDSATRRQLATGAAAQLPFDLLLANPDEIEGLLKQAVARGVTDLAPGITTALDEALAAGDYDQIADILLGLAKTPEIPRETVAAFVADYTTKVNEAMAAEAPPVLPPAWTTLFSGTNPLMPKAVDESAFNPKGAAGSGKGNDWWSGFTPPPEANTAITNFDGDVTEAMTNASLVTTLASDEMIAALSAMSDGVVTADEEIAMAVTGNTMTTSFETMATSAEENAEITKAAFKGILATVSQVDMAMSAFFNGIMAKVSAVNSAIEGIGTVPTTGGGGGNTTVNNVNVNTTNNVQGEAQATVVGYQLAATIRGMA